MNARHRTHQTTRRAALLGAWLFASSLALASASTAQVTTFAVSMDGGQSGTGSAGTGFATVTLDQGTGAVTVSGTYSGLTGNQTVAHIHGPAAIGANAGTVLTITGSGGTSGTLNASGTFTPAQVADMLAIRHYINVHSTTSPGGEIRGHIAQEFNVDCPAELVTDPTLADNAGNATYGPRIGHATERFNLSLDCTAATAPAIYAIDLRLGKAGAPAGSMFGDIWGTGPKLFGCNGSHSQNVVTCFPGAGFVLPNDVSFVGLAYTAQGYCGAVGPKGRTSNAITQVVGV